MISKVQEQITQRLGGFIFGFNEDTLDAVIAKLLLKLNLKVCLIEKGTNQILKQLLEKYNILISESENMPKTDLNNFDNNLENLYKEISPNILLVVELSQMDDKSASLSIQLFHNEERITKFFQFGGHDNLAITWATNTTLHFLRSHLI